MDDDGDAVIGQNSTGQTGFLFLCFQITGRKADVAAAFLHSLDTAAGAGRIVSKADAGIVLEGFAQCADHLLHRGGAIGGNRAAAVAAAAACQQGKRQNHGHHHSKHLFHVNISFQTIGYVADFLVTGIMLGAPCEIQKTRNVKSRSNRKNAPIHFARMGAFSLLRM